jgi:hypothetical protein
MNFDPERISQETIARIERARQEPREEDWDTPEEWEVELAAMEDRAEDRRKYNR